MAEEGIVEQRAATISVGPAPVHYPDSDGLPMAENDLQGDAIRSVYNALKWHFTGRPDLYLTGDLLVYYVEGDPEACVAPDVMVVLGVPARKRPGYKLWEEGKAPDFVLEVSSPSSRATDRTYKRDLYASLGVREYFLFDPDPGDGGSALLGYRLWGGGGYVAMKPEGGTGGTEELRSEVLELALWPAGELVRLRDLRTGEELPWLEETKRDLQTAEEGRQAAEARVAELEALLKASNVPFLPSDSRGDS